MQACSRQAALLERQHGELGHLHAWIHRHSDWEVAQWMWTQWKLPPLPEVSTTPLITGVPLFHSAPSYFNFSFAATSLCQVGARGGVRTTEGRRSHPQLRAYANKREECGGAAPADPASAPNPNSSAWEPVSLLIHYSHWVFNPVHY